MGISPFPCGHFPPGEYPYQPPYVKPPEPGGTGGPEPPDTDPPGSHEGGAGGTGEGGVVVAGGSNSSFCHLSLQYVNGGQIFAPRNPNPPPTVYWEHVPYESQDVAYYAINIEDLPDNRIYGWNFDSATGKLWTNNIIADKTYHPVYLSVSAYGGDPFCNGSVVISECLFHVVAANPLNEKVLFEGSLNSYYSPHENTCDYDIGGPLEVSGGRMILWETSDVSNAFSVTPSGGFFFVSAWYPPEISGVGLYSCYLGARASWLSRLSFYTLDDTGTIGEDGRERYGWYSVERFPVVSPGSTPALGFTYYVAPDPRTAGPMVENWDTIIPDSYPRRFSLRHEIYFDYNEFSSPDTIEAELEQLKLDHVKVVWSSTSSLGGTIASTANSPFSGIELINSKYDITVRRLGAGKPAVYIPTKDTEADGVFSNKRDAFIDRALTNITTTNKIDRDVPYALNNSIILNSLESWAKDLLSLGTNKICKAIRLAILAGDYDSYYKEEEVKNITKKLPAYTSKTNITKTLPINSSPIRSFSQSVGTRTRGSFTPQMTKSSRSTNEILAEAALVSKSLTPSDYSESRATKEEISLWYTTSADASSTSTPRILNLTDQNRLLKELNVSPEFILEVSTVAASNVELNYNYSGTLPTHFVLEINEDSGLEELTSNSNFVRVTKAEYEVLDNTAEDIVDEGLQGSPYPYMVFYVDYRDPILWYLQEDNIKVHYTTQDISLKYLNDYTLVRRIPKYLVIIPTNKLTNNPFIGESIMYNWGIRTIKFSLLEYKDRIKELVSPILEKRYTFGTSDAGGCCNTQEVVFKYNLSSTILYDGNNFIAEKQPRKSPIRRYIEIVSGLDNDYNTSGFVTMADVFGRTTNIEFNKMYTDVGGALVNKINDGYITGVPVRRVSAANPTGLISIKDPTRITNEIIGGIPVPVPDGDKYA